MGVPPGYSRRRYGGERDYSPGRRRRSAPVSSRHHPGRACRKRHCVYTAEPCLLRNGRGALNSAYLHDHGALRVPAAASQAAPGTVGLACYGVGAFTFGPRDRYAARRHCLRSALSGAYESGVVADACACGGFIIRPKRWFCVMDHTYRGRQFRCDGPDGNARCRRVVSFSIQNHCYLLCSAPQTP